MVIALLRYINRSAVKLDKAEITQQLLAYLPKEGGFLMETLAQEWIEEGKSIGLKEGIDIGKKEGIDIGKKEGIDIGKKEGREVAQRQIVRAMVENGFAQETIARLLNTSEAEVKQLLENLTENDDGASS
jgi:predicted transposase YdaD